MANAGGTLGNVDKVTSSERSERVCHGGSGSPAMPHLDFTGHYLDEAYPSIKAPLDERLDDLADDARDKVFQHGLQIAEEIRSQMHKDGRRRHEPTTTTTTTTTTTNDSNGVPGVSVAATTDVGKQKDEAKCKGKLEGYTATKSSSLRRRRSVRIPGEESGITYQVRVCIDRGDNEHEGVCAVSEGSIGANLNDMEQSDMLSLEQDMPLCLASHFVLI